MVGRFPEQVDEVDGAVRKAALESEVVLDDLRDREVLELAWVRAHTPDRVTPRLIGMCLDSRVVGDRDRRRLAQSQVFDQLGLDGEDAGRALEDDVEIRRL